MSRGAWLRPYDAALAAPYAVDAWPAAWTALAPPAELLPLTSAQAQALGYHTLGCRGWFRPCDAAPLAALVPALDAAIGRLGGACAVRLGTRSPKDSLRAQRHGLCVRSGAEALALFLEGSQRCAADLRMALEDARPVAIVLRRWLRVRPEREFRCVMRDRRWVGASQARVDAAAAGAGVLTETAAAMPDLLHALDTAMARLCDASPVPDAVFDVAVPDGPSEPAGSVAWLLDANPLSDLTDLGWFGRPGAPPRFDHTLRYWHAGEIVALALPAEPAR